MARQTKCAQCGADLGLDLTLCDECIAIDTARSRIAQGLPPKVTDPDALAKIARLARGSS